MRAQGLSHALHGPATAPATAGAAPPMGFAPAVPGSWLLFEVDRQVCAIDSRHVRQILPGASVVALPGQRPSRWPGMAAWQRRALPVLDGGAVFGHRPSLGGEAARVLVVHDAGSPWALLVDHVRGVHQEDPQRLIDVQPGLPAPWNAVRALLPLPAEQGGDACPVLHVPTLYRDCLQALARECAQPSPSTESRS